MLLFLMLNSLMNLTSEPSRRGGLLGCNQCLSCFEIFMLSLFSCHEIPQEGVDCNRSHGHKAQKPVSTGRQRTGKITYTLTTCCCILKKTE